MTPNERSPIPEALIRSYLFDPSWLHQKKGIPMPNKRQVQKNLKQYGQKAKGKNKHNIRPPEMVQKVLAPSGTKIDPAYLDVVVIPAHELQVVEEVEHKLKGLRATLEDNDGGPGPKEVVEEILKETYNAL